MSSFRTKLLGAAVAVTSAVLIAAGCGSDENGGDEGDSSKLAPKDQQVLNVNISADIEGFDPAKGAYADTYSVVFQMMSPLYRLQGKDSELEPYIAAELPEISDDGKTYTIKLRDDAKWSDGTMVTADDAVAGIQHALDPKTGGYYAGFMLDIVGACEYNAGDEAARKDCPAPQTDGKMESVGATAVDDHTLEIKLNKPVPWFSGLMSVGTFAPIPKAAVEKYGDKWADPNPDTYLTNGAFKLKSYERNKMISIEKNDSYWDADKVNLETINFEMVEEAQTARKKFEEEELDTGFVRTMFPTEEIDRWKDTDEYMSVPSSSINYLYLNTTNEKLKDPKVRQGIALAIDRKTIVDKITKRGDVPAGQIIPTILPGFDTIKEGSQDFIDPENGPQIDKAKELLKEGGWKDGDSLTMYYVSGGSPAIPEAIQSDLGKVGVKIELKPTPGEELQQPGLGVSPTDAKVDSIQLGWIADYLDAQNYYQLFICDNVEQGLNSANFCDEEFDGIYEEALKTTDDDARFELYKQLEARLTGPEGLMPAVPLTQPTDNTITQTWVDGLEIIPSGLWWYETTSILDSKPAS